MSNKYEYNEKTAALYKSLGITGTTYEPTFNLAKDIIGDLSGKTILDFGSGAGRSSKFLYSLNAKRVIGVDHNKSMVDAANGEDVDGVEFHHIEDTIPFEDDYFEYAFSSWVFMEMSSISAIERTFKEIYRVLLKGGIFYCIVATPESAYGHDYVSFKYIDSPRELLSGDKTKLEIKTDQPFIIEDHFWTIEDYQNSLENVGFKAFRVSYPELQKENNWLDESSVPAHMIITVKK